MTALASSHQAIAAEFPAWEITITPNGMWSAYWESEDRPASPLHRRPGRWNAAAAVAPDR